MADDKQHSPSPVPGADKFSKWLHGRPGVGKFHESNFRTSRVSSRGREPKLRRSKHHVQVDYYAGGFVKIYRISPSIGLSVEELEIMLIREFAKRNHRGGNGMSPKEPIVIPDAIRRRQEFEANRPCPAPLTPTPEVRPMETPGSRAVPTLASITLTPHQAEAYRFLLSLDPTGQTTSLTIVGVLTRLVKHYDNVAVAGSLFTALKKKGLVVPGKRQGTDRHSKKLFTIIRREIVESAQSKRPAKASKPSHKETPPAVGENDPLDHLEYYERHRQVIIEWERRCRLLSRRGYAIEEVRGRLALVRVRK